MKKNFKFYALTWGILFAVFNVAVFLVRPVVPGFVMRYDARFWLAWVFIIAAFAGNLVCAYIALRAENLTKLFYNLPLITVSRTALVLMLVVGCSCMLIPNCPAWVAAVACLLILAFNAVAVINAAWAADAVENVDNKIKTNTAFIKSMTADAEGILARAKSDAVKAECKKVYEALRYSDPVSVEALSVIEEEIAAKMDGLSAAVAEDNAEKVKNIAGELTLLVGDRNKKCKAFK